MDLGAQKAPAQAFNWLRLNFLQATATQSTTRHGGSAARAIDGNSDSNWRGGSCTHTGNSASGTGWWQLDLGTTKSVSAVSITNRGDCCGSRLDGFSVLIDGTACASKVAINQGETKLVPCND